MRLGIAQINTTVGDLAGNRRRLLEAYEELVLGGAELVVFPELALCGYPPRDLLFKRRFVPDLEESLRKFAAAIGPVPALVGTVEINRYGTGRPFFNSAALCVRGAVAAQAHKCLLPTYDVFDEDRYFEPAARPLVAEIGGARVGITICEDIWTHPTLVTRRLYHDTVPLQDLIGAGCDLMVNLSASPWHHGKGGIRYALLRDAAFSLGCPVAYVNAIGGNDELVFDGRSRVITPTGAILGALPAFREAVAVVDTAGWREAPAPAAVPAGERAAPTSRPVFFTGAAAGDFAGKAPGPGAAPAPAHPAEAPPPAEASRPTPADAPAYAADVEELPDIFEALVLGLRDYALKSGFRTALVALSGGIDSALVAVIAAAALGAGNVTGVSLPSAISSDHSRSDARELAARLGIRFETVGIAGAVAAAESALAPLFTGRPRDVAEENIQARVRGVLMMALSNKFGSLLLTTGNKSELAVGYCTLYGDMCGGLAVISDVFKTQVYALARWINAEAERNGRVAPIPASSIEKPPSAELRPGQTDQDSLPPYPVLDAILAGYVEEGLSVEDLRARGYDAAVVADTARRVDLSEYKRKQAAPGLRITPLAFGVGRRIPIVQRYAG